ncbi:unnamed protein product [Rhodiola kirilowii]
MENTSVEQKRKFWLAPTEERKSASSDSLSALRQSKEERKSASSDSSSALRQLKEEQKSTSSDSSSAAKKKVVIKSADMREDMQAEAIDIAVAAFEKHSVEKDVAEFIKKEFDIKHGPTWHCIVGSYVTHETNHFVYFYLDHKAVLLFKSG